MILVFPYLSIIETQANLKSEGVLSVGPLQLEMTKNLQRQMNAKRQSAHKSIGLRWQHEMDYLPKRHGTRWPETLSYFKVRTTIFYFLSSFFFLIFFFSLPVEGFGLLTDTCYLLNMIPVESLFLILLFEIGCNQQTQWL